MNVPEAFNEIEMIDELQSRRFFRRVVDYFPKDNYNRVDTHSVAQGLIMGLRAAYGEAIEADKEAVTVSYFVLLWLYELAKRKGLVDAADTAEMTADCLAGLITDFFIPIEQILKTMGTEEDPE